MDVNSQKTMLLSSSIDGYLGVYDLRKEAKERLYAMSDNFEEDLTGVCILKQGRVVAVPSQEGVINLF